MAVKIYSPAKTVADCFKFRNKVGLDVADRCSARRGAHVKSPWMICGSCRNRQSVENHAPISGGDCMNQNKKNVAHSIFQRLLNRAKPTRKTSIFCSPGTAWSDSFTGSASRLTMSGSFWKGVRPFLVWKGQNYRVTRDADFLGFGNADTEQLADLFRDICRVEFQGDGMIYLPDSRVRRRSVKTRNTMACESPWSVCSIRPDSSPG